MMISLLLVPWVCRRGSVDGNGGGLEHLIQRSSSSIITGVKSTISARARPEAWGLGNKVWLKNALIIEYLLA